MLAVRELEPKSFRLLQFLIEHRERVVTKQEILAAVWARTVVSDNALTRAIAQIRKCLADHPKQPRYIETVPTVGYRLIAEVDAPSFFTFTGASHKSVAPVEDVREGEGPSIAVLPFANLSADKENEYFADGQSLLARMNLPGGTVLMNMREKSASRQGDRSRTAAPRKPGARSRIGRRGVVSVRDVPASEVAAQRGVARQREYGSGPHSPPRGFGSSGRCSQEACCSPRIQRTSGSVSDRRLGGCARRAARSHQRASS